MDAAGSGADVLQEIHRKILQQGIDFEEKIKKLAMPLRLSLMVPISNRRVQIFEPSIISLIDHFIDKGFTYEKQQDLQGQQEEQFWNSDQPHLFEYKMCQIGLEHLAKVSGVLDITQPLDEDRGTGLLDKLMHVLRYRDDKGIKDGKGGKNHVEEEAKE